MHNVELIYNEHLNFKLSIEVKKEERKKIGQKEAKRIGMKTNGENSAQWNGNSNISAIVMFFACVVAFECWAVH